MDEFGPPARPAPDLYSRWDDVAIGFTLDDADLEARANDDGSVDLVGPDGAGYRIGALAVRAIATVQWTGQRAPVEPDDECPGCVVLLADGECPCCGWQFRG